MTPEQTHAMLDSINEMLPVQSLAQAVQFLLPGVFAAALLLLAGLRRRSAVLLYAAACAAVLVVLGMQHVRFTAYSAVLGAVLLPVGVQGVTAWLRRAGPGRQAMARVALILSLLLAPQLAGLADPAQASSESLATPACSLDGIEPLLAPYAGQVVLADVNDTPELLHRTGVLTVGSLYFNVDAFMRLRAAWRSPAGGGVPDALRQARVSLVLVCPGAGRSLMVADLPPDTLLDRLTLGQPPAWLRRVGDSGASGYVLYRVEG